jgi:5-methylcytosine-specific restriction endonuclease McrA
VTQWRRAYIAANYKRVIETKRAWRKKNPHAIVAARHRRRAARKRVPSNLTANGIRAVFETFGNACAYCFRTDRKLTVDHVVPLTEGGHDTLDNIVPACGSCNSRKGARSILYMLNRCPSAALAA